MTAAAAAIGSTGFIRGANLPWLRYGGDFGANVWSPTGGLATHGLPASTRRDLEQLRAGGIRWLRWFVFCDGRAGIEFDAHGVPAQLDGRVKADIDEALRIAGAVDMQLVPTLLDFHWCARRRTINGVSLGGHRAVLARGARRDALLQRVLVPLFTHVGAHPAVAAWDIVNEPEWATFAVGTWDMRRSIRRSAMRCFIRDVAAAARVHTGRPVTVGSASARWLDLVRDLGLDFYQVHWYDHMAPTLPLSHPVAAFELDRPVVLGEFPTRGSRHAPDEILDAAITAGYVGGWFWSVQADDVATDRDAALRCFVPEAPPPAA